MQGKPSAHCTAALLTPNHGEKLWELPELAEMWRCVQCSEELSQSHCAGRSPAVHVRPLGLSAVTLSPLWGSDTQRAPGFVSAVKRRGRETSKGVCSKHVGRGDGMRRKHFIGI